MIKQTGEQRLIEALAQDMAESERASRLSNERLVEEILERFPFESDMSGLIEEACTRLDPEWMHRDPCAVPRVFASDKPRMFKELFDSFQERYTRIAIVFLGILLLVASSAIAFSDEPKTVVWTVSRAVRYCERQRQYTGRAACQLPVGVVVRRLK